MDRSALPALAASGSLYQHAMGQDFHRLAPALQRFHQLQGHHILHGQVRTEAPQGRMARLLGRLLGTPLQPSQGAIRFELRASPEAEQWTRYFPQQRMQSLMRLQQGRITEQLGAARLSFVLEAGADGGLRMQLHGLRFLGIPCPRWLQPRLLAQEHGEGSRLHFHIRASVPGIGLVSAYRGHLELDQPQAE